jgi:hypothetical protein
MIALSMRQKVTAFHGGGMVAMDSDEMAHWASAIQDVFSFTDENLEREDIQEGDSVDFYDLRNHVWIEGCELLEFSLYGGVEIIMPDGVEKRVNYSYLRKSCERK